MVYSLLYKHLIVRLDAEMCHDFTINFLAGVDKVPGLNRLIKSIYGLKPSYFPQVGGEDGFKGIKRPFPGLVGLAAGMDKDARCIPAFSAFGFAFVEVGTVTPQPQSGNEPPRLWRIPQLKAIRNRMGFNNDGAVVMSRRLKQLRSTPQGRSIIVGVNLGKNKVTALEQAAQDYVSGAKQLARWADYLVINVSSPNTPGLRQLQDYDSLKQILAAVKPAAEKAAGRKIPILVKIAPDLSDQQVLQVAQLVEQLDLGGVIATNTTINHSFGTGGLSGPPVIRRALEVTRLLRQHLSQQRLIIGCGGISDYASAQQFLDAGADLLQVLTAMVYQGPGFVSKLNRKLAKTSC